MKKITLGSLAATMLLILSGPVFALPGTTTGTFTATAIVPSATGANIYVQKYLVADPNNPTVHASTTLDFGLAYNSTYADFRPAQYFAINVAPNGVAGANMSVGITYVDVANPNGASTVRHGLGYKANIACTTFVPGLDPETALISARLLKDVTTTPISVTTAQLTGKALKVYVGVNTTPVGGTLPAGYENFNTADKVGTYTGTVTITATTT